MQIKISGEQPFQVLSTTFSIGPSSSGYDLYFSADGKNYTKLFTVGANVNRQVTQVAAGSYYKLSGNTDNVTVNWYGNCVVDNGGGGSYVLPVASDSTLGGVKIGSGLTIDENGVLSSEGGGGTQYTAGSGISISGETISVKVGEGLAFSGDTLIFSGETYVLPVASDSTLGGVKIGSGITIDENGAISAAGGGGNSTKLMAVGQLPATAETGTVMALTGQTGEELPYGITYQEMFFGGRFTFPTGLTSHYQESTLIFLGKAKAEGGTFGDMAPMDLNVSVDLEHPNYLTFTFEDPNDPLLAIYMGEDTPGTNTTEGISFEYYISGDTYVIDIYPDVNEGTEAVAISDVPQIEVTVATYQYDGEEWGKVGGDYYFLNDMTTAETAALFTKIQSYWDGNKFVNYPVDKMHLYWWIPDPEKGAGYDSMDYRNYVEVMPRNIEDTEWSVKGARLCGTFNNGGSPKTFRVLFLANGEFAAAETESYESEPPTTFIVFGVDGNGDIGGDLNYIRDESNYWNIWFVYNYDQSCQEDCERSGWGQLKWVNRYKTLVYNEDTQENEEKWYYVFSSDIPEGTTIYTGVWGFLDEEEPTAENLSWTSGGTYESQSYPAYTGSTGE